MARPRIRLLIPNDPHPMRIERDLAQEIGLNESIVLLQLEYLITIGNNERDGRMWTYQSLQDLHEIYFPWWSVMTISRIVKSLEEKQLIIIGNYNKLGYDRTQWYALNDEGIARLSSVLLHTDAIYQIDKSVYQNGKSIYQNDDIDPNKMINGTQQIDTTIPKSTQRLPESVSEPKKPKPLDDLSRALFELCLVDPDLASGPMLTRMRKTYKGLRAKEVTQVDVRERFTAYWYSDDNWMARKAREAGRNPEPPTPEQVSSEWQKAMAWKPAKKPNVRVAPTVGLTKPVSLPPDTKPPQESAKRMLELRDRKWNDDATS